MTVGVVARAAQVHEQVLGCRRSNLLPRPPRRLARRRSSASRPSRGLVALAPGAITAARNASGGVPRAGRSDVRRDCCGEPGADATRGTGSIPGRPAEELADGQREPSREGREVGARAQPASCGGISGGGASRA